MAKKKTKETRAIEKLLKQHFPDYPLDYPPEAYRYSPGSIRVRIVSEQFKGKDRGERDDMVFPILRLLPEEIRADIMILAPLAPDELERSMLNMVFEDASPSGF